jgi:hypothetical protein
MSVNEDPSTWRLQTDGGIPYKLKAGPKGSLGSATTIEETIIIQASMLKQFLAECQIEFLILPTGALSVLGGRTLPGIPTLWVNGITFGPNNDSRPCDPFSSDGGAELGTYEQFLELGLTYAPLGTGATADEPATFLEVTSDAAAEFLTVKPSANMFFQASSAHPGPDGVPITAGTLEVVSNPNLSAYKLVPQVEWSVNFPRFRWEYLGYLVALARPRLGKVNLETMAMLGNAQPETILFVGMSIRQECQMVMNAGVPTFKTMAQVNLKFSEKYVSENLTIKGHNHFYREDTGTFDRLLIDGDSVYTSANLSAIWEG